ncbi:MULTISPECIES: activator-dependent family glycosyltransferase [unclassified Streptomyces]|uniref:activator-dependent family glycosyltransferase n=1 Tax=unclassified Streptomyces TaxID=2593676 RepID=UPI0006F280E0|nr:MULTISPECIES: activator-dependent family glycosyltransferase [unclassified Streptomyces]KQX56336.1 glycosyl transferase family 28 [Streptomyces sp. Root1304]KRA97150.1 glycosyl transferase family 28 [Streptomyces sp. Root66D1]
MRVLFVTLAASPHFFVQVPLAWALRAAGHDVRVASQPDLMDTVTAAGLSGVPVGPRLAQDESVEELRRRQEKAAERLADPPDAQELMRIAEDRPERLTPDFLDGLFTVMTSAIFQNFSAEETVDDLVALARRWRPDLVVWDTLMMGGPVAARACGAAHARLLYGLDLVGAARRRHLAVSAGRPRELREDPLAEWLGWTAERYGVGFTEDLVTGQWTLDPTPPSLRPPTDLPWVPVRHIPYNGRSVVPEWLREPPSRRRVCLTLGLSFREVMGGERTSVPALLESLGELDAEVVATLDTGQLAEVGRVPDNVRVVDFVPLDALLPSCSAIVHQGGFGTAQNALAHGVPQVVVPNDLWDIHPRAALLERSGAGLRPAGPGPLRPAELRDLVTRVLEDPSYARNAARLRDEIRATPSPAELVPVLEALTGRHRGNG